VNFLIDSSLSPAVAETLRHAGHDAVHVRHYGIHKAEDEIVFDRAAEEDRVVVSAGTRFATVLSLRRASKPSVIVFRRLWPRRAEALANLLLTNLPNITALLDLGSIVIFEEARLRSRTFRPLPFKSGKDSRE
jgi:predicted nuclease of predicted toxin-antitoxin system